MKIAYLFSRYPVPSQTFCDTEIRALEAAGHEIEIYSCSAPTTSFRHGTAVEWPHAKVLYAPPTTVLAAWEQAARQENRWPSAMVAEHEARFGPRYDPARRARHALYFADRLLRRGVQHLHVHFANRATHAALFIHELIGIPFSFTAHAQDFLIDLGNDDLLRLLCERAAFIVAVSEWSRRALVERCPESEPKIHRIYNGLDLNCWPLSADALAWSSSGELKIFSVGRLVEFKGFQDLIAACRLLKGQGIRFSCEIAGDGPLREVLEREAAEFNTPSTQIRLLGLLSQAGVRARLEACDLFVLASRVDEKGACDVLPTVILEAMAMAKAVVSTRLAGIPELVVHGETGWLVPPGDPAALGEALVRLNSRSEERARMGQAGHRRVSKRFSAVESAHQLGALFEGTKPAGSLLSDRAAAASQTASVHCIFDRWPLESGPTGAALAELTLTLPGLNFLALKPGEFSKSANTESTDLVFQTLSRIEFLPDSMVLETFWRKDTLIAHRLESWRAEVGGACESETFLLACRRALYLHHTRSASSQTPRHFHAIGPESLLCIWLLQRLDPARSNSFLLSPTPGGERPLAGSTLRKLATGFVGGWIVGERKLTESLGPAYVGDKFRETAWIRSVVQWSGISTFSDHDK